MHTAAHIVIQCPDAYNTQIIAVKVFTLGHFACLYPCRILYTDFKIIANQTVAQNLQLKCHLIGEILKAEFNIIFLIPYMMSQCLHLINIAENRTDQMLCRMNLTFTETLMQVHTHKDRTLKPGIQKVPHMTFLIFQIQYHVLVDHTDITGHSAAFFIKDGILAGMPEEAVIFPDFQNLGGKLRCKAIIIQFVDHKYPPFPVYFLIFYHTFVSFSQETHVTNTLSHDIMVCVRS